MLTFAFCTYNRADRLDRLVSAMRAQACPVPYEILAVNNNSQDDTQAVLTRLAADDGAPLRWVTESVQGIVAARNRALAEAMDSDILVFIDDDELPSPGLLSAAYDAITREGAQSVGGRVEVDFSGQERPAWLESDLLGFLAQVDYGNAPFWITDDTTPLWTANVAYDMRIFREDASLRFDKRFDRRGNAVGGGSDAKIFKEMLRRNLRLRYRPEMLVLHSVEAWRLSRRYFLRLHYLDGRRTARFELPEYNHTVLGIPPFMLGHAMRHLFRTIALMLRGGQGLVRQAMNFSYAVGMMTGYRMRRSPNQARLGEPS